MASPSPTNSPDWHRQGTCQQPYETLPQLSTSTHSISNVYVPYNATLPNPPPLPYDNIHPQTYHEGAAYHTPAFPRQSGPHRHGAAGTTRRIVHSHQPNTVRPSRAPRPSPYHRPALAGPHTTPHSPGDPSDSTGAYTLSPLAQTLGLGMDDDGFTHAHAWPASFGARLEGLCEVPAAHVVQPGSVPAVRWTAPGGGGGDPDGFRVYGERGEDDVRGWAAPDSLGLALGADSALLREDEPMDEGGGGAGYPAPTQACYDTERGASDSRSYAYAHS
ncbi:hypothetical protein B0H21DRAFT_826249 [Amylocystis lapponica]|nr:hypothetical protein B0H21DRAFT_826249 [Amylocystis lapponica]